VPKHQSKSQSASLVDAVRSSLAASKTGFRPWHERLTPEAAAEVDQLRRAWVAGELGTSMRPVAKLVSQYLAANNICTVGVQGVVAWLKEQKRS